MSNTLTLKTNRAISNLRKTARELGLVVSVTNSRSYRGGTATYKFTSGNPTITVYKPLPRGKTSLVLQAGFKGPGYSQRPLTKANAAYLLENALWSMASDWAKPTSTWKQ